MNTILLIDDEQHILDVISAILEPEGYKVLQASSGEDGLEILRNTSVDVIISDMRMQTISGLEVLKQVKNAGYSAAFIILTAYGSIEDAVECMHGGAYSYIVKPFNKDEIRLLVKRAIEHRELLRENILLKKQLHERFSFDNIVGKSEPMQRVYDLMEKISQTDSTVLIYGESGTGKELVAKALHYHGPRKNRPFVAINCGGLPESLLESELFGHVRGSFTGAISDKVGLFQVADTGTIFLDEISVTSPAIQVKLLRVLQEFEIKKVGDTKDVKVDVRVIAATNRKMDEEVRKGLFREDLFYRLSVIPIFLPPLRERREDIPLLAQHFLEKHRSEASSTQNKTIGPGVMEILMNYSWPGNVRELENVIERAITLSEEDVIQIHDLPENILHRKSTAENIEGSTNLKDIMRSKEREFIRGVLTRAKGDKKAAAEMLGIDLATLYRKLQE